MSVEEKIFFRQFTKALCSSLEIQYGLKQCLHLLKESMPVESMILATYDPQTLTIHHIASVGTIGDSLNVGTFPLPPDVGTYFEELIDSEDLLVHDTQQNPLTKAVAPFVDNYGCSEILIPLRADDHHLGYLVLQAKGYNRFSQKHVKMLAWVREPLAMALSNTLKHQEVVKLKNKLEKDNTLLQEEIAQLKNTTIVGRNRGLRTVMEQVSKVAPLSNTVLILGETGVGKEVIANAIHDLSPRKNSPFIKINCGAIPESLIDSELFGHEKGAFTGALTRKLGRFEQASGGTIFLDEIGELPPAVQVRLLRVMQHREIERVGGHGPIPVDIRIIAATHRDLEKMVQEDAFREDLWFRLNVFPLFVPPLRSRREDIPRLLDFFIEIKSRELGLRNPPPLAPGALNELLKYPWPGNVRELENVVERALIQNKGRNLTQDAFVLSQHANGPLKVLGDQCGCVFPCLAANAKDQNADEMETLTLDELAARHIRTTLEKTGGKIHGPGGAAELLGVNASTLRNRMNKLGISYGRRSAG